MALATLEQDILDVIKLQGGMKRIDLKKKNPTIPFHHFRMALAELVAKGNLIEIEYTCNGIREFFYISGLCEVKIRGKGI